MASIRSAVRGYSRLWLGPGFQGNIWLTQHGFWIPFLSSSVFVIAHTYLMTRSQRYPTVFSMVNQPLDFLVTFGILGLPPLMKVRTFGFYSLLRKLLKRIVPYVLYSKAQ